MAKQKQKTTSAKTTLKSILLNKASAKAAAPVSEQHPAQYLKSENDKIGNFYQAEKEADRASSSSSGPADNFLTRANNKQREVVERFNDAQHEDIKRRQFYKRSVVPDATDDPRRFAVINEA